MLAGDSGASPLQANLNVRMKGFVYQYQSCSWVLSLAFLK